MILLTGATGLVGSALLRRLVAPEGPNRPVRCLVRDPRRLGPDRVRVQIALGDLADPPSFRNALRGVQTVIHLAATIRDQQAGSIEELNGIATWRLVRAAERAGVERFVFFSAIGATLHQRTRFFRSKALAEDIVEGAGIETTVISPSIVYERDDPWITLMRRLALLPLMPVSGSGRAAYEPVWARDVARATLAAIDAAPRRYELAGPERLTYDQIARLISETAGRSRPLLHVPLPFVRSGLIWLRRMFGERAFATWEEAELMEVPMVSRAGGDIRALGVEPTSMRAVLQG